jgi:hypothetical protein
VRNHGQTSSGEKNPSREVWNILEPCPMFYLDAQGPTSTVFFPVGFSLPLPPVPVPFDPHGWSRIVCGPMLAAFQIGRFLVCPYNWLFLVVLLLKHPLAPCGVVLF